VLTVDNSTLTNNNAGSGRDLYIIGIGAGQTATAQIHSSIIAQSDVNPVAYDLNATDDLGGQVVVTGSNNLIRSQNFFRSITFSAEDPLLGALAMNGGPTRTHALLAGSPAIGHGSNLLNMVNDQRGDTYARVVGGAVDIGAYELQTVATPNLAGDYDSNQTVDAADYVIWRKTKDATVTQYSGADGNGSGTIDDADYDVWRGNFGASSLGSGTEGGLQRALVTVEPPPDVSSVEPNDIGLIAPFSPYRGSPSDLSIAHSHNWLNKETASNVSQDARDEALLAITSQPYANRISNGLPNAGSHSGDGAPPLEDAIGTSELAVHCESQALSRKA
jgi:hypothetical protein